MKFKLVIKLVDCVPSKVNMTLTKDDASEAVEHAQGLYEANATIDSITVYDDSNNEIATMNYEYA